MKLTKEQINALTNTILAEYKEYRDKIIMQERNRIVRLPEVRDIISDMQKLGHKLYTMGIVDTAYSYAFKNIEDIFIRKHSKSMPKALSTQEVYNKLVIASIDNTGVESMLQSIRDLYIPKEESKNTNK